MDLQAIKQAAATYGPAMTKFLREIVAFPGESAEEKDHVKRIEQEMKDLGFDEVEAYGEYSWIYGYRKNPHCL